MVVVGVGLRLHLHQIARNRLRPGKAERGEDQGEDEEGEGGKEEDTRGFLGKWSDLATHRNMLQNRLSR